MALQVCRPASSVIILFLLNLPDLVMGRMAAVRKIRLSQEAPGQALKIPS
jgi:hypothetical protein